MHNALPDGDIVGTALSLAAQAASVHGEQRWQWRVETSALQLFLDPARAGPPVDAEQRALLLGCGLAVHHLCTAFRARGWSAIVHRLPDPADPDHVATVGLVRRRATPLDAALYRAITRRTECEFRRAQPIPPGFLGLADERAATLGAAVRRVPGPPLSGYAEVLAIGTSSDDRESRLRAGEALSAVLLTAANVGLTAGLLSTPLRDARVRNRIRREAFDGCAYPQAVLAIS
ncbi:hypothetical protein [Nocardia sp. NPDC051832]|uniref:hypothetical protein n=1 Tax=Nocardia sp. NPDC051832 TaxID=3155673 RepID=UPI003439F369